MKKVITAAMVLGLLATSAPAALAQDGRERGERWQRGDGNRGDGNRGPRGEGRREGPRSEGRRGGGEYNPAVRPSWRNNPENAARRAPEVQAAPQVQAAPPAPAVRQERGSRAARAGDDGRRERWDGRRDGDRNWSGRDRNWGDRGDRNWNDRDRNWNDRNRNWSDRDRNRWSDQRRAERPRYDRRAYPWVYRVDRRFHAPRYRAPSGFYARSWSYGHILPRAWFGPDYVLTDWWSYGLPIPPVGYDWVRVGDDALLVDSFTGRVVQVVYDLFW